MLNHSGKTPVPLCPKSATELVGQPRRAHGLYYIGLVYLPGVRSGTVTACVKVICGILPSYGLPGLSFLFARMWEGEDGEIHVYVVNEEAQ